MADPTVGPASLFDAAATPRAGSPDPSADGLTTSAASTTTVEALVRAQLSKALGGRRGIVEGAVPTLGFTVSWIVAHDLRLSLVVSGSLAVLLLLVRLVQRSTVQFVVNSMVGIAIAAAFALRSGRAEDAFLPGLIYNAVYFVVLAGSALARWPLVGFMVGSVAGEPTQWHADKQLVSLCSKLTALLALPCALRVAVQYPLYAAHEVTWLGIAKLGMGWPLQLAALAVMALVLNRDRTPVVVKQA